VYAIDREEKIEMKIKLRENRWNTQGSFRKLDHQIRGRVKPNTANKFSLIRVTVPDVGPDVFWKHIIGKDDLKDRLVERNVEQLSHAGATPFVYTDLRKELFTRVIHKWYKTSLKGHSNMLL
jgi:hypothetical protein